MKNISCVSCFLLFTAAIYIALVLAEYTSVKMEEQRIMKAQMNPNYESLQIQ